MNINSHTYRERLAFVNMLMGFANVFLRFYFFILLILRHSFWICFFFLFIINDWLSEYWWIAYHCSCVWMKQHLCVERTICSCNVAFTALTVVFPDRWGTYIYINGYGTFAKLTNHTLKMDFCSYIYDVLCSMSVVVITRIVSTVSTSRSLTRILKVGYFVRSLYTQYVVVVGITRRRHSFRL